MVAVRKLLTWVVVTFGIAALVRWWRSRSTSAPPAEVRDEGAEVAGDPADELRRKLAEARGGAAPAADPGDASVEERRAEVHAEGRAAIDEMRSSQGDA